MKSRTSTGIAVEASAKPAGRSGWLWGGAGLAAAALLLAACASASSSGGAGSPPSASSTPTVSATGAVLTAASTPLGQILVDGQGKTVYMFAKDSPGKSNCEGTCLTYWPAVTAPGTLPASLPGVSAKLGSITRSDGSKQLTINGWPAYTYAGDSAPGMTSGQGKNLSGGLWWVLAPSGSKITASPSSAHPSASQSSSSAGGGWA